jgi:hypothetical protein
MLSNQTRAGAGLLAVLTTALVITGCTNSPTTGRTQFNLLPAEIESGVSDFRFGVKTALASGDYCRDEEPCAVREAAEKLAQRVAPIAERLGTVAPELSPELVKRVPRVEVFVIPNDSVSVSSSAGGKIAVGSGLGRLDLSDTDLALALSREFGRLAAAHHRESTSAGLAVSLVTGSPLVGTYIATSLLADALFPMGALLKVGISLLGSMGTEQLVEASQQEEADDFAGKLMLAAGYDVRELAEARAAISAGAVKIGWLPRYVASRARVAGMTLPAEAGMAISADPSTLPTTSEIALPLPEVTAGASDAPALQPDDGIAASLTEVSTVAATGQEALIVASTDVTTSPFVLTTTAAESPEPSPPARAEAARPAPRTAATKQRGAQPKAKPVAAKKAAKPPPKKTTRSPVKKKAARTPSRSN